MPANIWENPHRCWNVTQPEEGGNIGKCCHGDVPRNKGTGERSGDPGLCVYVSIQANKVVEAGSQLEVSRGLGSDC